ncbi:MAG: hypothetical protein KGL39_24130 [Patescibacteria group bacterium]|nr:hypothetical protein [Patescibacteria group bacterium]
MAVEQNVAAVRRALARRADLQKEIEQIDLFLMLYKQFSEEDKPVSGIVDDNQITNAAPPSENDSAQVITKMREDLHARRKGGMSQSDTEAVVRDILLANGRPMVIPDLIQRIREKGRIIGGQDEISNLKTKLWRAKGKITNISGAGYWPSDIDCAVVGYAAPQTGNEWPHGT